MDEIWALEVEMGVNKSVTSLQDTATLMSQYFTWVLLSPASSPYLKAMEALNHLGDG